ncbi:MAG: hypothetical protein AAFQ35_04770 [Pseudomonadota bacterium]
MAPRGGLAARIRTALSDGGPLLVLRRSRQTLLRRLHEGLIERLIRPHEPCATAGKIDLTDVTVASPNRLAGSFYDPTPRLVIRWLLDAIAAEPETLSFIDVGTGRGRVVMEAMRYPFRRVIGIEFAAELAEAAEENVASAPLTAVRARRVGIVHADATTWSPPIGSAVYFLYNPFDAAVLARFLERICAAHQAASTSFTLIYVNPVAAHVLEARDDLKPRPLDDATRLKLTMLSPYAVARYVFAPKNTP